jgi:branched-chain amino acid transport system permease protein
MTAALTPRNVVIVVLMLLLAAVPVYAAVTANTFLVTLFTRVIILGMAATSLNLILGYGGMVSFGHAVYLGIGGYAVGILCLALLVVTIYLTARLVNSRFGMVIQGARSNDRRMRAIGFATFRYRLTAFVIAGAICGLAGALLANHTGFISPATMHWTRSGDLIVMVVLGGMASPFGPLVGAVALLSLEEALPVLIRVSASPLFGDAALRMAEYWQIVLGPLFLLVVLFARGGIDGLLAGVRRG